MRWAFFSSISGKEINSVQKLQVRSLKVEARCFFGIFREKQMLEEVTGLRNTILQNFFFLVYCSEFSFYLCMTAGDQNPSYNEIRELDKNSVYTSPKYWIQTLSCFSATKLQGPTASSYSNTVSLENTICSFKQCIC